MCVAVLEIISLCRTSCSVKIQHVIVISNCYRTSYELVLHQNQALTGLVSRRLVHYYRETYFFRDGKNNNNNVNLYGAVTQPCCYKGASHSTNSRVENLFLVECCICFRCPLRKATPACLWLLSLICNASVGKL